MSLRSSTHSSDMLHCDYGHTDTSFQETVHAVSQARYPSFSGCEMPLFRSIRGRSDTFDRRFDQRNPTLELIL